MDNWLVTAVAAATTATAALLSSLVSAPAHDTALPHAVGTVQRVTAAPRPAPEPWVAPVGVVQAAVSVRPSRSDFARTPAADVAPAPDPGPDPAASQAPTASTAPRPVTPAVQTTPSPQPGSTPAARPVVRRSVAARPLMIDGVPARRVIGIRRALGMRPVMGDLGTDVSWPQCRGGLPMPLAAARFVVVGLTDGPAFSANHCLAQQAAWVRTHHRRVATYAVVSYPTRHELRRFGGRGPFPRHRLVGRLRNVGFHEARINLRRMHGVGLHSPIVWIDLEPSSSHPWHRRTGLNAAVVRGLVHGYRSSGQRIGFYSTALIWHQIAGRLRFGAPEWRTAGPASPRAALSRCGERGASIQGGPAVLAQWWNNRRDHDLLCPGHQDAAGMARWFERR